MNYPVWETATGGGLLIAVISILHVFVSHFAIGGGLFLVLTEHYAYRKNDAGLIAYLTTHSRVFALLTLVFGAVTGVGIWFTIGLVSPAATSSLIRIFVFGWATEWVFFFVEIAAAILYYHTWRTVDRRTHLAIGWVYFVAAFLSLIVINGILTFMLTPGRWLETRSFWDGFFNPTYAPSAVARTAICVALAGVYALITGLGVREPETRARLVRYAGAWAVVGIVLTAAAIAWYHAALPTGSAELLAGAIPTAAKAAAAVPILAFVALVLALPALLYPARYRLSFALVAALAALLSFGSLEWVRESVRKPFVIEGYMYSTGLKPGEPETLAAGDGLLAATAWAVERPARVDATTGEDVFRFACRSCHTLDGYRAVPPFLRGLDESYIADLVRRVDRMQGRMPPFPGNETEARALALYLARVAGPPGEPKSDTAAFARRCGFCHSQTGALPLRGSFEGSSREDIVDVVRSIGDLSAAMPAWTGSEAEAGMIADHVLRWYEEGAAGEGE